MAFGKIQSQALPLGKVVPLVLNQLKGDPVLHVAHLGETNVEYWNDALAKANTRATADIARRAASKITPELVRKARQANRETVAKYAVKELENVFHDDGRPATKDDVGAVVEALPDEVFDSVLAFVSNAENFRDRVFDDAPSAIAGK